MGRPPTPKRRRPDAAIYSYYASYSAAFVDHMLMRFCAPDDIVFDPWNGSDTTTERAVRYGLKAVGTDLNPAMVVVSRGRLLPGAEVENAQNLLRGACAVSQGEVPLVADDPLLQWFYPAPAAVLRGTFRQLLDLDWSQDDGATALRTLSVDTTRAWCVTALFIAVRRLLAPFLGSNPTWVRVPKPGAAKLRLHRTTVVRAILDAASTLASSATRQVDLIGPDPDLVCADSQAPPRQANASTVLLTSPPYCTRIDYAVATRPELAVLGCSVPHQAALRQKLMGNPNVRQSSPLEDSLVTNLGSHILRQVREHPSKASATYYARWLTQYLLDYARSLEALSRACRDATRFILVVQDSYYKTVHLPLAAITAELAAQNGWAVDSTHVYSGHASLAWINPASRRYRGPDRPAETVLVLTRSAP